jgi:hypothetical protein
MAELKDKRFPAWHQRNATGKPAPVAASAPEPDVPAAEPDKPAGKKTTK